MTDEHNCETPLKEFSHKVANNKQERILIVTTLCECAKIISYGVAAGVLLGIIWFTYDYLDKKFNSGALFVTSSVSSREIAAEE